MGLDESILLTAFREGKELLFDEEILVDDEELHSRKLRQKASWLPILYYLLISFAILGFVIYIVYFLWIYSICKIDGKIVYFLEEV